MKKLRVKGALNLYPSKPRVIRVKTCDTASMKQLVSAKNEPGRNHRRTLEYNNTDDVLLFHHFNTTLTSIKVLHSAVSSQKTVWTAPDSRAGKLALSGENGPSAD